MSEPEEGNVIVKSSEIKLGEDKSRNIGGNWLLTFDMDGKESQIGVKLDATGGIYDVDKNDAI